MGGVSVQDPFSEGSDPAFHNKRGPGPGGAPYQQGGGGGGPTDPSMRMQYEANKDPYGGPRKGEERSRERDQDQTAASSVCVLCCPLLVKPAPHVAHTLHHLGANLKDFRLNGFIRFILMCLRLVLSAPGPGEAFGPGQMPSGAMQDMYPRGPPSGPLTGMGPRPQYPYGPGYERR